jgi:hypothetical protein
MFIRHADKSVNMGVPIAVREDGTRAPLKPVKTDGRVQLEALATVARAAQTTNLRDIPAASWVILAKNNPHVAKALQYSSDL